MIFEYLNFSSRLSLSLSLIIINECLFQGCRSTSTGGALYIYLSSNYSINLISSTFLDCKQLNTAIICGGAYISGGLLNLIKCCFSRCSSYDDGSAFYAFYNNLCIINYTTILYCSQKSDNSYQDSFKTYCYETYLNYLNSSNNYFSDLCSGMAFRSQNKLGIISYSTFSNLISINNSPFFFIDNLLFNFNNFINNSYLNSLFWYNNECIITINNSILFQLSNTKFNQIHGGVTNIFNCQLDFIPTIFSGTLNTFNLIIKSNINFYKIKYLNTIECFLNNFTHKKEKKNILYHLFILLFF